MAVRGSGAPAEDIQKPPGSPQIKCLLGMVGVDCHTKGIRTLARLLRDSGVEVVYVGEHNTSENLLRAAVDEDVDAIGVSFSTATYLHYAGELARARRDLHAEHIPILLGGLIHTDDEPALKEIGIDAVFGPSSNLEDVMTFLRAKATSRA